MCIDLIATIRSQLDERKKMSVKFRNKMQLAHSGEIDVTLVGVVLRSL